MDEELKTVDSVKPKNRGCLITVSVIVASFLMLIVLIIGSIFIYGRVRQSRIDKFLEDEQVRMEAHLKEKYGKEFVVKDIEYVKANKQALGDWPYVVAYVDPVDYEGLNFSIRRTMYHELDRADEFYTEYGDGYISTLWGNQAKSEVEALLQSVLGFVPKQWTPSNSESDKNQFAPEYSAIIKPSEMLQEEIYGTTMSYKEAKEKHSTEIEFDLMIYLYEGSDVNEDAERVFEIVEFIKLNKFGVSEISYSIKNKKEIDYGWYLDSNEINEIETVQNVADKIKTYS